MNKSIESKCFNINNKRYKLSRFYDFKFAETKTLDKKFNTQVDTAINIFLKVVLSNFKEEDLPLLFSNLNRHKSTNYFFIQKSILLASYFGKYYSFPRKSLGALCHFDYQNNCP